MAFNTMRVRRSGRNSICKSILNSAIINHMENNKKKPKYNQEQYDILKRCSDRKNISKWNEWRKNNPNVDVNLEAADLRLADLKEANLWRAKLEGAIFMGTYLEEAYLAMANLKGANLMGANLGGADIQVANLEGAYLRETHLEGAKLLRANLEGANLEGTRLEGAKLGDVHIGEYEDCFTNFEEALFGDAVFSINEYCKTDQKKIIEALSKAEVNNIRFIDPVFGRKVRDEAWLYHLKESCKNSPIKNFVLNLWKWSCDYGRSIFRWALWLLILAELFAIIFGLFNYFNPLSFESKFISFTWPGISFLYYSIVTFTTLGFGDIVPKIPVLQIIVMVEVILGYIMLGGLISILANKLARRND